MADVADCPKKQNASPIAVPATPPSRDAMLDSLSEADTPAQPAETMSSARPSGDAGQRFAFLDALRGLGALG